MNEKKDCFITKDWSEATHFGPFNFDSTHSAEAALRTYEWKNWASKNNVKLTVVGKVMYVEPIEE